MDVIDLQNKQQEQQNPTKLTKLVGREGGDLGGVGMKYDQNTIYEIIEELIELSLQSDGRVVWFKGSHLTSECHSDICFV